jgi:Leucine-rich repeat (LRR) protein
MASMLLVMLSSCAGQRYNYTFNDNVVFSPNPSLTGTGAVLRDSALQGCLNQILQAAGQTDPATVKLLACPGSGVETLAGIETLQQLEQLELSDNRIEDISPLSQLKNLRVLGIRNNRFSSISALQDLSLLRFVSLQGNDRIPCSQLETLKARLGNTLSSPDQCTE